MADPTQLSDSELLSIIGGGAEPQPVPTPDPAGMRPRSVQELSDGDILSIINGTPTSYEQGNRFVDAAIRGVTDIPEVVSNIPRGLATTAIDAGYAVTGDLPAAERTARTVGRGSAGFAGALEGGTIGSAAGPIGTGVGAILGGAAGLLGFDFLEELIGTKEPTTAAQKAEQFIYDTTQGGALGAGAGAVTGIARGVAPAVRAVRPLSKGGKVAQVAEALDRLDVEKRLNDDVIGGPGAPSLAEQFDDATLAQVETQIPIDYPEGSSPLVDARRIDRAKRRTDLLDEFSDSVDSVDIGETGGRIREQVGARASKELRAANKLWDEFDKDAPIDISGAQDGVLEMYDKFQGEAAPKLPGDLRELAEEIFNSDDVRRFEAVDNWRKRINDISYDNTRTKTVRSAAKTIERGLDQALEQSPDLQPAIDARAAAGQQFEQGSVAKILKRKKYGEPVLLDSQIADEILRTPEAAMQFMGAADDASVQMMRDYIGEQIRLNLRDGKLASIVRFSTDKTGKLKPQIATILEDRAPAFQQFIDDVKSEYQFNKLASQPSRGQSITGQRLSGKDFLADLIDARSRSFIERNPLLSDAGGALLASVAIPGPNLLTAPAGAAIMGAVRRRLAGNAGQTARLLYQALSDADVARQIIRQANLGSSKARAAIRTLDNVTRRVMRAENLGAIPAIEELGRPDQVRQSEVSNTDLIRETLRRYGPAPKQQVSGGAGGQGTLGGQQVETQPKASSVPSPNYTPTSGAPSNLEIIRSTARTRPNQGAGVLDSILSALGPSAAQAEELPVRSESLRRLDLAIADQMPSAAPRESFFQNQLGGEDVTTQLSGAGLDLIKQHEGLRLKSYKDVGGVKTIGYGHTGSGASKSKITEQEAEQLLVQDVQDAEQAVADLVNVPLEQNQFDALVSLVFNIGAGAFKNSTLLKKLNAGDVDGATKEFLRWNKVKGRVVSGLTNRRRQEAQLFSSGGAQLV